MRRQMRQDGKKEDEEKMKTKRRQMMKMRSREDEEKVKRAEMRMD